MKVGPEQGGLRSDLPWVKVRRVGSQILWAGLEVLGPKDDVEEKEKEKRKKNLFFFFLILFLLC